MKTHGDNWKINALVDGELDLANQLELEERLQDDPALRRQVEELRALREAVREHAERHAAPAALRERMTARLQPAPQLQTRRPAAPRGSRAAQVIERWFGWRPLAASLAFGTVLAVALNVAMLQSWRTERLMDEVVASHVRSTLSQHLVDVASSDHHTVKPFLSARLDFSPPVDELREVPGAQFLGGRVDYLDDRPVAALVYRQGEHVVNSFVWPEAGMETATTFSSERGYQRAHWSANGMTHCVISDVNREEFQRIVKAMQVADSAH